MAYYGLAAAATDVRRHHVVQVDQVPIFQKEEEELHSRKLQQNFETSNWRNLQWRDATRQFAFHLNLWGEWY